MVQSDRREPEAGETCLYIGRAGMPRCYVFQHRVTLAAASSRGGDYPWIYDCIVRTMGSDEVRRLPGRCVERLEGLGTAAGQGQLRQALTLMCEQLFDRISSAPVMPRLDHPELAELAFALRDGDLWRISARVRTGSSAQSIVEGLGPNSRVATDLFLRQLGTLMGQEQHETVTQGAGDQVRSQTPIIIVETDIGKKMARVTHTEDVGNGAGGAEQERDQ